MLQIDVGQHLDDDIDATSVRRGHDRIDIVGRMMIKNLFCAFCAEQLESLRRAARTQNVDTG